LKKKPHLDYFGHWWQVFATSFSESKITPRQKEVDTCRFCRTTKMRRRQVFSLENDRKLFKIHKLDDDAFIVIHLKKILSYIRTDQPVCVGYLQAPLRFEIFERKHLGRIWRVKNWLEMTSDTWRKKSSWNFEMQFRKNYGDKNNSNNEKISRPKNGSPNPGNIAKKGGVKAAKRVAHSKLSHKNISGYLDILKFLLFEMFSQKNYATRKVFWG